MKGLKVLGLLCLICLTGFVWLDYSDRDTAQALDSKPQIVVDPLPTVGSLKNLQSILAQAQPTPLLYGMERNMAANSSIDIAGGRDGSLSAQKSSSTEYSQTNNQVEGVDEADTVKTDGKYIYKITNNKVIVARVYPAEEMQVVSTLRFAKDLNPVEMYVDSKHLTVILNKSQQWGEVYPADTGTGTPEQKMMPRQPLENSVLVLVYDLGDRTELKQVREIEIDGGYISSRMIASNLYLVNNKFIPIHLLKEQPELLTTPSYRDSFSGGELKKIAYEDICYFPGSAEPNYLIIAAINLDNGSDKKTEVKTYLGSGQNIYSSLDNLFVAVPEYKYLKTEQKPSILPIPVEENTSIYKFALQDGGTEYRGKGSIPGRILNQFSMDEHNGYFRIATTEQRYNANAVQMTNNLFVLDQEMKLKGKLENIAPGEKIYSVRFLGDRGYLVTFKTVDPLFVLDLKNPQEPKVLGELKIPGYSNYLHPFDENHIIGFGKEAIEIEEPHWSGQGTVKNAYYLGMKIALFDVSDVHNPKEKFKVEIGDRGTDSELFWNHKALLFNKENGLLSFPVTVYDIDPSTIDKNDYLTKKDPRLAYGQPVFQGAFVYNLSLKNGFELRGKLTHQPEGNLTDLQRMNRYDYNLDISRIIYIEDTLYTVSNNYLQANDLGSLTTKGGIQISENQINP